MARMGQQIIFMEAGDRPHLSTHKGSVNVVSGAGTSPPWLNWDTIHEAEQWADEFVQQLGLLRLQVKGQMSTDEEYDAAIYGEAVAS